MKKFVFFFNLTAIAMFFVLFYSAGTHAGCTKDIDCKGNRICEKGICVDPGQNEPSSQAGAAWGQKKSDDWLKKLDGAKFIGQPSDDGRIGHERDFRFLVYYISGQSVRHGWIEGAQTSDDLKTASIRQVEFSDGMMSRNIQNKQFNVPQPSFLTDHRPCPATISDDGQFLTIRCPGSSVPQTYTRVK